MSDQAEERVTEEEIDALISKLKKDATGGGYLLNPDDYFTRELTKGLIINERRYGYQACPCRLASGNKAEDLDIICPCDYRDPDLTEYDACFCALYVSKAVVAGEKKAKPLPDRRNAELEKREKSSQNAGAALQGGLSYPVWRCKVCGYLTAREAPPENCPICKVPKERFELFIAQG